MSASYSLKSQMCFSSLENKNRALQWMQCNKHTQLFLMHVHDDKKVDDVNRRCPFILKAALLVTFWTIVGQKLLVRLHVFQIPVTLMAFPPLHQLHDRLIFHCSYYCWLYNNFKWHMRYSWVSPSLILEISIWLEPEGLNIKIQTLKINVGDFGIFITEKVVWAVPNISTCSADKAGCLDGAAL